MDEGADEGADDNDDESIVSPLRVGDTISYLYNLQTYALLLFFFHLSIQ